MPSSRGSSTATRTCRSSAGGPTSSRPGCPGRRTATCRVSGGGIFRSARPAGRGSDDQVLDFCLPLAAEMLAHGTTALELKTGYGLSVEGELRQARLARGSASEIPQTTTVTLLACHAVPEGMERARLGRRVCRRADPGRRGRGTWSTPWTSTSRTSRSPSRTFVRVAEAAREPGLPFRCHADQLGHVRRGGGRRGARVPERRPPEPRRARGRRGAAGRRTATVARAASRRPRCSSGRPARLPPSCLRQAPRWRSRPTSIRARRRACPCPR